MDAEMLARILHEELEKDGWGDIDPYLFKEVSESGGAKAQMSEDAYALEDVLARVCRRIEEKR